MSDRKKMPRCLGQYDKGDTVCDGDPNADDESDKLPCVFRDRCVAFKKLCKDKGHEPDKYLTWSKVDGEEFAFSKVADEKFQVALDKLVVKHGIKGGRITNRKGAPPNKPVKKGPGKGKKPSAGKTDKPATSPSTPAKGTGRPSQARESAGKLYGRFIKRLSEETGRPYTPVPGDRGPGDIWLVDRMEKSNYAAVYGVGENGARVALASVYPNARTGLLQIRIAAPLAGVQECFSAPNNKKLSPQDYDGKDGHFKTRLLGVDNEGLSIVAEGIARAIEQGIIVLPDRESG